MTHLSTTDNNCGAAFTGEKSDYQNLIKIANTSINDLTHANPSLLVFPHILGSFEDGIKEQHVF